MKKYILFLSIILTLNFELYTLNCKAQYSKLFDFDSINGYAPSGSVVYDGTYLYGMTQYGGTSGEGVIFKIKPDGTSYSKLLDFTGINGSSPVGDIYYDGTFLYGMTQRGGLHDSGTVFKIMRDGTGYSKLLDFGGINGNNPFGSLIYDGTFLYGMTAVGGINNTGTIFKIDLNGSSYSKLHDFDVQGGTNGNNPTGSLISDGTYLYGMAKYGGANGLGMIFKIMLDGSSYTKLFDFSGTASGSWPNGSLMTDGTFLYGTTSEGGLNDQGSIFKIKYDGTSYTKLHDFAGGVLGNWPKANLLSAGGLLYGTASAGGVNNMGIIFKLKTDGTEYADQLDFSGTANGSTPFGSLISDGTFLYGMTMAGGANNIGTVFKYALATGIAENNDAIDFDVYPNPGNGHLSLTLSTGEGNVSVYNVLGEKIYHIDNSQINKSSNFQIDLSSQPAGIYFIQVMAGQGMGVKKIIIQ